MTYNLDFVSYRKFFYLASLLFILLSIGSLLTQGLNLGIDFVSGTRLDIRLEQKVNLEESKRVLEKLGYPNPNARVGGQGKNILIFRTEKSIQQKEMHRITQAFQQAFQTKVSVQSQVVDPIIGRELARNALIAVVLASVGIVIYVSFRFEFRFAVAAIIALFYDALFTIGVFSIFQIEVDIVFIAAILTIVGYSVNDTIVIFDRIRENLEESPPKDQESLKAIVNASIQQTLVRSLNTMITVLFAAAALYFFGGESIENFSLALLLGLLSGAYSSILIASQIWFDWKRLSMKKATAA